MFKKNGAPMLSLKTTKVKKSLYCKAYSYLR